MTQASHAFLQIDSTAGRLRLTGDAGVFSGVSISVHDSLESIERDWRAFEERAELTVFQTFDWLSTWYRHIGMGLGLMPAIVIGRDRHDEILFLLPLSIRRVALVRRLEWLGSELSDYNAPLLARNFDQRVRPQRFAALAKAVMQRIQDSRGMHYDLAVLEKMPALVGALPNFLLSLDCSLNASGAHVATLPGNWDDFYRAKRSPTTRRRDRTKLARLSDLGAVRLVNAETDRERQATVANLIEQKERVLATMGVANFFARPGHRRFFEALATSDAMKPLTHLSRLDVGSSPAAVNLGLTFRGRYYYLLSSYETGDVSRLGPGAVHLRELMRQAIERKFTCFDFTIGDEPYKRDWCDFHLNLFDHISTTTLSGLAAALPEIAMRRLKRHIKQTPWLWRLFSKLRASIA